MGLVRMAGFLPTYMSFTSWTGGHRPCEPREPGEAFICRPVLGSVSFSERNHFKLVSVWVFEKLDVNPSAPDQRVVAAGQRQSAGEKVNIRPLRQLVPAHPAQNQGGGAPSPLLRHGSTCLTGLVQTRI